MFAVLWADTAPGMAAVEAEPARTAPAGADAPALVIGRLYEQHYRMIRGLCKLLLRSPVEAEDAAQQTFLSAFSALIGGTVPRRPAPWLAMIARRECWARTTQRRASPTALDESGASPASADPLERAIANADLAAIWRAIADLPRQQRDAFLMREFSGLSYAEVAVALGATESATESLLVRARRQLRDGLEASVGAANAVATPFLLLQHRFGRLFGKHPGTAAAGAAGIPVAAKLGAAFVSVAVGAAGVGVGVKIGLRPDRTQPSGPLASSPAQVGNAAAPKPAGPARPRGTVAVAPFGRISDRGSQITSRIGVRDRQAARLSRGDGGPRAADDPTRSPQSEEPTPTSAEPTRPTGPAPADPAPAHPASTDATAAKTTPTDTPTTDTPTIETATTETAPTETAPTETAPTETAPTETAPTDTSLGASGP